MRRLVWTAALIAGCDLGIDLPPEPNCEDRQVYYPDPDGDGLGDPTTAYVGCEAPAGWVTIPDTGDVADTDTDVPDTDTDVADTDTDVPDTDTDVADTDDTDLPVDTDVVDTDTDTP